MRVRTIIISMILAVCLGLSLSYLHSQEVGEGIPKVLLLEYDGVIHGGTVEVMKQALEKTKKENFECLILKMDTPGGTVDATRKIVKQMLNSQVPTVVYVAPSGSRAGSAGTFITMAGNVAAMAPGTNIGAAHPVMVTGEDPEKKGGKHMAKKIEEDTAAFIESIANERGRNVKWARKAVLESSSITNEEALKKNVVDLIAKDVEELLQKMDGMEVKLKNESRKLATKGATISRFEMDLKLKILNFFAQPTVVMFLVLIMVIGIYVEISHPGLIFPAVAAGIALLLLLFSTQVLPISYLGLLLIICAMVLFILEIKITSFGLLTLGGLTCFFIGSMLLFDPKKTDIRIPMQEIIISCILIAIIAAGILIFLVSSLKKRQTAGWEGLKGLSGKAVERIEKGKKGKIFVNGEYWSAKSQETIEKEDEIEVTGGENLLLHIKKKV